jgi:hypothetical protein
LADAADAAGSEADVWQSLDGLPHADRALVQIDVLPPKRQQLTLAEAEGDTDREEAVQPVL